MEHLLGLTGELSATVAERTQGNPLFAVQLIGDWVNRGVLVVGNGGFELAPGVEAPVPDAVHDLWTRRLDRILGHRASEVWPESTQLYKDALAIHREMGNRRLEGMVLGDLANQHWHRGEMRQA